MISFFLMIRLRRCCRSWRIFPITGRILFIEKMAISFLCNHIRRNHHLHRLRRRRFFLLSERFAGSGNGDGGRSSRRTKSRYSTLVRLADLSLISTMSARYNGITPVAVISALTFLQIFDRVYNLLHGLSLSLSLLVFVCLLRKFCVLILLLDFLLTTKVELSFCLVVEIIYIYSNRPKTEKKYTWKGDKTIG